MSHKHVFRVFLTYYASWKWSFIDRRARKTLFCPLPISFVFCKKKREKQYLCYKKYGVHQGLSGLFDLVWLQYSSSARKTHSPSACACSPSSRTANSSRYKKAHFAPLVHNILLYLINRIISIDSYVFRNFTSDLRLPRLLKTYMHLLTNKFYN